MRAPRVTCKLCGARGSVRYKLAIPHRSKNLYVCHGCADAIESVNQLRRQLQRASVPGSGDAPHAEETD